MQVRAAGINFADVLVRLGRYPQAPELPTVLGAEFAGEIDGRRVMGLSWGGGSGAYAEQVAALPELLVPLPDGASFEEGASFLTTFLTAWIPLTRQARVGEGSVVLVHAAAGGVGSAAVQVAKHLGARVVATASSDEKRRLALDLGAEEAYGYDDFAEQVRADVVLDPVGGEVFERSLGVLQPLGLGDPRRVSRADVGSGRPRAAGRTRTLGVQGFYLGRLMRLRPDIVREAIGELLELWQGGAFKPLVGATFALAEAAEAHRLIEGRRSVGKVVLVP